MSGTPDPEFELVEGRDPDGTPCLALRGELDLRVTKPLYDRIWSIAERERRLRLDMSGLTFLDSTGISVLVIAVKNARADGWKLQISPEVTPAVRRTLENSGIDGLLWPPPAV